jgi:hypothetical protein
MEQLENQSIYKRDNYRVIGAYISEKDQFILETLGNGNISEGCRIAIAWSAHFYNLGLNTEMSLENIGLVTVSSTDKHVTE